MSRRRGAKGGAPGQKPEEAPWRLVKWAAVAVYHNGSEARPQLHVSDGDLEEVLVLRDLFVNQVRSLLKQAKVQSAPLPAEMAAHLAAPENPGVSGQPPVSGPPAETGIGRRGHQAQPPQTGPEPRL